MVHSVHNLARRILARRIVDHVDHVKTDCPHGPQTVVYTVVCVHTVLCKMGSGRFVWTIRMVHKKHCAHADNPRADSPYADDQCADGLGCILFEGEGVGPSA